MLQSRDCGLNQSLQWKLRKLHKFRYFIEDPNLRNAEQLLNTRPEIIALGKPQTPLLTTKRLPQNQLEFTQIMSQTISTSYEMLRSGAASRNYCCSALFKSICIHASQKNYASI